MNEVFKMMVRFSPSRVLRSADRRCSCYIWTEVLNCPFISMSLTGAESEASSQVFNCLAATACEFPHFCPAIEHNIETNLKMYRMPCWWSRTHSRLITLIQDPIRNLCRSFIVTPEPTGYVWTKRAVRLLCQVRAHQLVLPPCEVVIKAVSEYVSSIKDLGNLDAIARDVFKQSQVGHAHGYTATDTKIQTVPTHVFFF